MLLVKDNALCAVSKWEAFFVEEKKRTTTKEDILSLEIPMYRRTGTVVKVFTEHLGVVEATMDIHRDHSCPLPTLVMTCSTDEYVLSSHSEIMPHTSMPSVLQG